MQRAHGGVVAASGPIVAAHGATLFDFAFQVTRDPHAALRAVREGVFDALTADAAGGPDISSLPALYRAVGAAALRRAAPSGEASGQAPGDNVDLARLAWELAAGLTARHRCALDLLLRQGLEGEALASALGVVPGTLSAEIVEVREHADRLVGAAVFAHVARGTCDDLAAELGGLPERPELEEVAARVGAHTAGCEQCADRRRALVPALALLARTPAVAVPAALTSDLEGRRPRRLHPRRASHPPLARTLAVVVLALLVTAGALGLVRVVGRGDAPTPRALAGVLRASVGTLAFGASSDATALTITDDGPGPLTFSVIPGVSWLSVTPQGGRLAPGGRAELTVMLDRSAAPAGTSHSAVRLESSTGTALVIPVTLVVERAPSIGKLEATPGQVASLGCSPPNTTEVTAAIVSESGVQSAVLHWRPPATGRDAAAGATGTAVEETAPLATERNVFVSPLGPFNGAGTVTWWVTAVDTRGDTSMSPTQALTVTGC